MNTFCGYRTRLLPQARAERFYRCQQANPLFTDVALEVSATSKNLYCRHYVRYRPANPAVAERLRKAERSTREKRAEEQAGNYVFWADPDCYGLILCLNLGSQEVYEVTSGSCNCGDFHYRGSRENPPVQCKHQLILCAQLETARAAELSAARRTEDIDLPGSVLFSLSPIEPKAIDAIHPTVAKARRTMSEDFPPTSRYSRSRVGFPAPQSLSR